jgi:hypothetical protein
MLRTSTAPTMRNQSVSSTVICRQPAVTRAAASYTATALVRDTRRQQIRAHGRVRPRIAEDPQARRTRPEVTGHVVRQAQSCSCSTRGYALGLPGIDLLRLDIAADAHLLRTMLATIPLLTLFGVYVLDLRWGPSLLLAAILAPTDPVLAHDVQVHNHRNRAAGVAV